MRSFRAILPILGALVMIFSGAMLLPLLVAWLGGDGAHGAFWPAIIATWLCGALLWWLGRGAKSELDRRDGMLLVSLAWTIVPVFACLPLLLYFQQASAPISFTDAYFEAVSGLTTTGATVLVGLDRLPASINLWRCFLQWLGGMGILVLMVAILPLLGVGGSQVFNAESTGPMKENKLTPRMAETAKGLWTVYCAISLACVLAYRAGGMNWMDAWVHMFSTMSLGGLSSHDASFGFFQSPLLEWTGVVFMLIASCNFALYFVAVRKRSLAYVMRDVEFRGTLLVMVGSGVLVTVFLLATGTYTHPGEAARMAFFNLVSIASTTGYATTDYTLWPVFAPMFMLLLSGVATSAGSTGAGIKMVRAIILFKQAKREMLRLLHPASIRAIVLNGSTVQAPTVFAVLAFMILYGSTTIVLTMALAASGLDFETSSSAIVASINNTGPGLRQVGPAGNYQVLTDVQTWICSLAMLIGRLEVLSFLVLLTPGFWRR